MPIPTQPYSYNPQIQIAGRKQLDRTFTQGAQTILNDWTSRPTETAANLQEAFPDEYDQTMRTAASVPIVGAPIAGYMGAIKAWNELNSDPLPPPDINVDGVEDFRDEILSPGQVDYEYGHLGLRSKEPIKRSQMETLANLKREERRRAEIWDAAPGGVMNNIGYLGAGLLSAAYDPLNIATGFIPAGGLTGRAATMLGSKFAGRLAIGGVEGLIGNAAVEPIVYYGSQALQADYTAMDAMSNLALGAILGSGIHAGGGYLKDRYRARQGSAFREAEIQARKNNQPAPEFSEDTVRRELSEPARGAAAEAEIRGTLKGTPPDPSVIPRLNRVARQNEAVDFNDRNAETALSYQIKRYRMYEMAEGREDLAYGVSDDIEDARIALMDAADKSGWEYTDFDDLKTKLAREWGEADPATDRKVRELVDQLKGEREQWKTDRRNPNKQETLLSIIREEGGLDPDSFRAPELRAILDGKNKSLGRGKYIFRKEGRGGPGLDRIGELAVGRGLYNERPGLNTLLRDFKAAVNGTEGEHLTEVPDLSTELGVPIDAKDEVFERAARMQVAEEMRPEPTQEMWDRTVADNPEEIRNLSRPPEEIISGHLDETVEYSLEDIKRLDTELDAEIEYLRQQGIELEEDEFDLMMKEFTSNEETIDAAFRVGVACVSNG